MAVLKVIKGQEFKVRVEDKVEESNIFYDEYQRAGEMLESILNAKHEENNELEFENNVIAFCGSRGDGKTSAMLTFMNEHKKKFVKQIVIDPSLFDNVHNILDIVLAELFHDFKQIYEKNNQAAERGSREELLNKFQKVYRQISLINNQTKILDSEYDYEGDIGKLSRLGESTQLKKNLTELIRLYSKVKSVNQEEYKNNLPIIIGIDDLDLCSENAYKMSEEIRKYLIIPGVVIVMAIRVEQLELCVREKNIRDFDSNIKVMTEDKEGLYAEVINMAKKYVEKLIPLERRIYLTKAQDITDLTIQFKENEDNANKEGQPLVECVLKLIYDSTGIIFRANRSGSSFLIPANLRGIVNLIALLRDMDVDKKVENISLLRSYFINEWKTAVKSDVIDFEEINNIYLFDKNVYVHNILSKYADEDKNSIVNTDQNSDLSYAVKWFVDFSRIPYEYIKKEKVYKVRALYSFTLNELLLKERYEDFGSFVNGFIWKERLDDVIPAMADGDVTYKRARFDISLESAYESIKDGFNTSLYYSSEDYSDAELLPDNYSSPYNPELGNRASHTQEDFLEIWLLLGLFLNTKAKNSNNSNSNNELIYDNAMYNYDCQACIENYIVGLAALDLLANKLNIEKLTNNSGKFADMLAYIKEKNKDTIRCAQMIAANMDIAVGILEYCKRRGSYKKASSNEFVRTMNIMKLFLDNMRAYLKSAGVDIGDCDFCTLCVPFEEKLNKEYVDVVYIYALLFNNRKTEEDKESLLNNMFQLLNEKGDKEPKIDKEGILVKIKVRKASYVKKCIETLAKAIQKYYIQNNRRPENILVDEIYELYKKVLNIYFQSRDELLSNELMSEYRQLAKVVKDNTEDKQS